MGADENNRLKRRLRRASVWLLAAGLAACGDQALGRQEAAAAISSRVNGPAGSLRVFRSSCVEKNYGNYPLAFLEDNRIARQYRTLEDAGLVTMFLGQPTAEQCGTPYLEHKQLIGITLTEKGAAEHWTEHAERGGGWDIVLAHRRFIDVTGIEGASDGATARAEFTWQFVLTAGGAALGKAPPPPRGRAMFERQNDGWRLTGIDY